MSPTTSSFVRILGATVLAGAAAVVMVVAGPSAPSADTDSHETTLAAALADYRSNEGRTSGAPQQEVVNGWFNRDALTIQIAQLNDLIDEVDKQQSDNRLPLLALLGVLGLCLLLATSPVPASPRTDPEMDDVVEPPLPPPPPGPFAETSGLPTPPLAQNV